MGPGSVEDLLTVESHSYILDAGTEASSHQRQTGLSRGPAVHFLWTGSRDTGASILRVPPYRRVMEEDQRLASHATGDVHLPADAESLRKTLPWE